MDKKKAVGKRATNFIMPTLWPSNNLHLNPVDYEVWSAIFYRHHTKDVDELCEYNKLV